MKVEDLKITNLYSIEEMLINEKKKEVKMYTISNSSRIASIGYTHYLSNGDNISLIIKFARGGIYLYKEVEPTKLSTLLNAASCGSMFGKIIDHKYTVIKIFPANSK